MTLNDPDSLIKKKHFSVQIFKTCFIVQIYRKIDATEIKLQIGSIKSSETTQRITINSHCLPSVKKCLLKAKC